MTQQKTKVGIIGTGAISGIYLENMTGRFQNLEVVACADMLLERAAEKAKEFGVQKACSVDEILADDNIDIIVNLTIPGVHAEIAQRAIAAGKHTHAEKPLAINYADGLKVVEAADAAGLQVGCAPDTFLGAAHQFCRQLIDEGAIGQPVAATAFMMCHGHESWHPDPEFYYKPGGGPMFDMGPYYLTALVNMLGPVSQVSGMTQTTFEQRTVTSEPKNGTIIDVEVPTHVAGMMQFQNGAVGTIITTFDVWGHNLPCIEIHGTEGSLSVPDPNGFGGKVSIKKPGQAEWEELQNPRPNAGNNHGIGVADLASAIQNNRPARAGGKLALHVLELMETFHTSSDAGKHLELKSTCDRPAILPATLQEAEID